ncbi:MAG: alpha/beta fold hydrolase [Ardenticatenaceae bacterium]|nr:alpha/beta fold hydrolase [Ardenticatenaceae bacterium]MCB9446408.1 alpha/beta fold hydrolase [Ardenticatenaceae bacterium]
MKHVGKFLLISLAIYLGITAVLILTDRPTSIVNADEPIAFEALTGADYDEMPDLQPYTARDGAELSYRLYESAHFPGNSEFPGKSPLLILLHGSGWHSMQFYPLAKELSEAGAATVVTPDLRGHGFAPETRGDVAYIGQLEDDLADLIAVLEVQFPGAPIIVGGHSSGGGLAVRFAGGEYGELADGFLLLAPFLKYNAPTTRPNSGGWAQPNSRRIAGLTMLNNLGIHWFDGLTVIQFAMPSSVLAGPLGGSATTAYSHRLNSSFAPRSKYGRDLTALTQPFLLVAGLDDEAFIAEQYKPTISQYTNSGSYVLLPNTGHIDLLTSPELTTFVADWLGNLATD